MMLRIQPTAVLTLFCEKIPIVNEIQFSQYLTKPWINLGNFLNRAKEYTMPSGKREMRPVNIRPVIETWK